MILKYFISLDTEEQWRECYKLLEDHGWKIAPETEGYTRRGTKYELGVRMTRAPAQEGSQHHDLT